MILVPQVSPNCSFCSYFFLGRKGKKSFCFISLFIFFALHAFVLLSKLFMHKLEVRLANSKIRFFFTSLLTSIWWSLFFVLVEKGSTCWSAAKASPKNKETFSVIFFVYLCFFSGKDLSSFSLLFRKVFKLVG